MRFSTITAALAFAFSVNAASLSRRAVSPDVQTCINDLVATDNQLAIVTAGVDAYTAADGYAGALVVQAQEAALESKLDTAGTSCCKTVTTVTSEDAEAVLAEIDILTPKITDALDTIIAKKSVFDSVPLVTILVKGDLGRLNTKTTKVIDCLIASTPAEYLTEAQAYASTIEDAFNTAIAAYA